MAAVDDSSWFGKALLAMLDDRGQTAVSELLVTSVRNFGRNEMIYAAGQPGKEMFVLTRGRVQLYYENNLGEKVVVRGGLNPDEEVVVPGVWRHADKPTAKTRANAILVISTL